MQNAVITRMIFLLLFTTLIGCKKEFIPKPKSQLRLDYPVASYDTFSNSCNYSFNFNKDANVINEGNCNFNINYPHMRATIYLNYKAVENNIDKLLKDAQKLTYQHVIKADDILEHPFLNVKNKVYGMYYQVGGNAASQAQFYLTDSIKNFVVGSVYFYAKPNFDSIMPAASYIENDIRFLMESLKWK